MHFREIDWRIFVAAQTYALGTVEDLNRVRISRQKPDKKKHEWYECDLVTLKGGVNRIQLINASANYFKHHDEWTGWPLTGISGHTTKILGAVAITETTEFPCVRAIELLCGTNWELIILHQILREWRAHLFSTYL